MDSLKIVTIGGGGGASQLLLGLQPYTPHLTGVIAVTDTGRSTGRARALLNIPAPGDIRNALGNLAGEDSLWGQVLQFRIQTPDYELLDGMAFGNLLLGVLAQYTGDFVQAVEITRALLGVSARVLPVTTANTQLCAELLDGTLVEGEFQVRGLKKPPIKRVFIKDGAARAYDGAVQAVRAADLIVMGPGSLFTTVLACLAFHDLAQAIAASAAPTVYVCNTTTQPGQTDGYTVSDHVRRIVEVLGAGALDYAIVNTKLPPPELAQQYAKDDVFVLEASAPEIAAVEALGVRVLARDVALLTEGKRALYQKQDSIRHDAAVIAQILLELAREKRRR